MLNYGNLTTNNQTNTNITLLNSNNTANNVFNFQDVHKNEQETQKLLANLCQFVNEQNHNSMIKNSFNYVNQNSIITSLPSNQKQSIPQNIPHLIPQTIYFDNNTNCKFENYNYKQNLIDLTSKNSSQTSQNSQTFEQDQNLNQDQNFNKYQYQYQNQNYLNFNINFPQNTFYKNINAKENNYVLDNKNYNVMLINNNINNNINIQSYIPQTQFKQENSNSYSNSNFGWPVINKVNIAQNNNLNTTTTPSFIVNYLTKLLNLSSEENIKLQNLSLENIDGI